MAPFDLIAFDADDTLWHSQDGFDAAETAFRDLLAPHVPHGVDIASALVATERANLHVYGYGVKAFGLSMMEAALTLSQGKVPTDVLMRLIDIVRDMLMAPARLMDHVPEVLGDVAASFEIVLVTKGDLVHQTRKLTTSGLEYLFEHVEIVLEKDVPTYRRVFNELGVDPSRVCMVGNSIKSDALPVLELGGFAVHIPYPTIWDLEHVEHPPVSDRYFELASLRELPEWLERMRDHP
jgi:putative hydrolase of the HAD superfamily